MIHPFKPPLPRGRLSAGELERLQRAVEGQYRTTPPRGHGWRQAGHELHLFDLTPAEAVGVIEEENGTAKYGGRFAVYGEDGATQPDPEGFVFTIAGFPWIELNGNPAVGVGTRVWLRLSPNRDCYLFESCCSGFFSGSGSAGASGSGGGFPAAPEAGGTVAGGGGTPTTGETTPP